MQESPARAIRAKAIDLLAAGKRVSEVATEIGKHERTLYAWLEREDFAGELDARLAAARARAKRILEAGAEDAAASLVLVAKAGEPGHGPRVAAARDILDRVGLAVPKEVKVEVGGNLHGKSEAELEAMVSKAAAGMKSA